MSNLEHPTGYDPEHPVTPSSTSMIRNTSEIIPSKSEAISSKDAIPFHRWMAEALQPCFEGMGRVTLVRSSDPIYKCFNNYSIKVTFRRIIFKSEDSEKGILIARDGAIKGGILPFRATADLPVRTFLFFLNLELPEYIDDWYDLENDVLKPWLTNPLADLAAKLYKEGFLLL